MHTAIGEMFIDQLLYIVLYVRVPSATLRCVHPRRRLLQEA